MYWLSEHEGVAAELSKKMIKHCHKWCDSFIQSSSHLHGSVNNLHLVSRPEGLMDNSIESDEEQEADPFGGGDVESDEEYNMHTHILPLSPVVSFVVHVLCFYHRSKDNAYKYLYCRNRIFTCCE